MLTAHSDGKIFLIQPFDSDTILSQKHQRCTQKVKRKTAKERGGGFTSYLGGSELR